MDLQPSGSVKEEIIFIETDEVYFSIKGDNKDSFEILDEETLNITSKGIIYSNFNKHI